MLIHVYAFSLPTKLHALHYFTVNSNNLSSKKTKQKMSTIHKPSRQLRTSMLTFTQTGKDQLLILAICYHDKSTLFSLFFSFPPFLPHIRIHSCASRFFFCPYPYNLAFSPTFVIIYFERPRETLECYPCVNVG